jgi:predicted class III extradiol MEMO1 family dioxygenase
MRVNSTRPAAVAGTWYPASPGALTREVDGYVAAAAPDAIPRGRLDAVIAPHAGLMFSGPVGAYAYKAAAANGPFDVVILAGPSHFVAFDGVALYPSGAFDSPLGPAPIDEQLGQELLAASPLIHPMPAAHAREHSLEMQLPFIRRLLPGAAIVPLLMGHQTRETIRGLADALAKVGGGPASPKREREGGPKRDGEPKPTGEGGRDALARVGAGHANNKVLLVASTDLSHYFDAPTAEALDRRVQDLVAACDPEGLLHLFEEYPDGERGRFVACGGGPAIAVMLAARARGAPHGRVLKYMHSGEISGDNAGVVGYLAGALGTFDSDDSAARASAARERVGDQSNVH